MRILDGYDGCVTSYSWPAWNYAGRAHQRCQWHYLNDLEDTMWYKNPGSEFASFARHLGKILYDSQKDGMTQEKRGQDKDKEKS